MSHASCLVVIDETELNLANGNIEQAVTWQMEPFYEGDEYFKDGSRWDWWQIGGRYSGRLGASNISRRGDISLDSIHEQRIIQYKQSFAAAQKDTKCSPEMKDYIYGVKADETLDEYLERHAGRKEMGIAHYAFLRNRHWHEGERLGWWGSTTATECERHAESADVDTMIRRCKHKDPETGACIVVWNEPFEIWQREYWRRFIEPLPPTSTLVTVDYHV